MPRRGPGALAVWDAAGGAAIGARDSCASDAADTRGPSAWSYTAMRRALAPVGGGPAYSEPITAMVVVNTAPTAPAVLAEEPNMLHYAVVFFVIALIAAVLGFGGIAASAAGIAKILFVVFLVLALASMLLGLFKGR